MAQEETAALPHWDMSNVYPGLEHDDFDQAVAALRSKIDAFEAYLKENNIQEGGEVPGRIGELAKIVLGYIERMNECALLEETISAYLYSFVATDSFNQVAKKKLSEHEIVAVRLTRALIYFQGWLRSAIAAESDLLDLIKEAPELGAHRFFLEETYRQAQYRMSQAEETLASELSLSGGSAWAKLQGTVTSQLSVPFEKDGKTEEVPMAALQNIRRYDPDESIRRQAFKAEIAAWESVRESLAACMNGVKGQVNTLNDRRGREDSLHASLDQSRLDRESLQALLDSMQSSFPKFREYFRAKAKLLGKEQLAWWDIFVPVGKVERAFSYDEARLFIIKNFERFSDSLAQFTARAFSSGWIDAEPRKGKSGGAFCMGIPALEESRILCNFDGSLDQVSTLAHELGHAFHNECHTGLTALQRSTPMTLAETASIFNETLITEAMLDEATSEEEELAILENFMLNASQVIVDIYSRFLFEKEVFERRVNGELSVEDFTELMVRSQRETYGDGLDEAHQHAYMWAWKPHYYSPNQSYYNYPYAFGLLFGLGLYAIYKQRGAAFIEAYESLLRSTGQGNAADLAERFGIDLRSDKFWQGSIDFIAARIDRYVDLANMLAS
ncbi:MAG: M3 family oligoendopeptidase [Anaerolineales bacterium]|nr:M3 family oligoendopeptidase [Anaerolineales bacterium]